ncbi:MAG TPA: type II toxin-antitoxin system RelE/ParE family toxin [Pyrinomonadaceae bacterium]|nr:type II toxin-antitoxin system RelE/ParE family toxin [Pyrinomonadaceae bacterium]
MASDYRLVISPGALADINSAAKWYEEREPGLGNAFTDSILSAIDNLQANPLIYAPRDRRRNVRWFFPPRFPHRIIYKVQGELITVFAVIHAARHDRNWKQAFDRTRTN